MKNRTALFALLVAGTIWGTSVALSKVSIEWLGPYWLTTARFLVAGPILALFARKHLRSALNWKVALNGALGFGVVMVFQNIGIAHTSVSHAAILVGAVPIVVALVAAGIGHARPSKATWVGYLVALLGIVMVAGGGGGGATLLGDGLVLASVLLCGVFIGVQPAVMGSTDPAAVTAVQFLAGALVSLPVSLIASGLPHAPVAGGPVLAFAALAVIGTILPFWLFAYGQAHVPADLAGAFLNLEPLVGAVTGWVFFGNHVGSEQIVGALAVVVGILLGTVHWDRLLVFERVATWPELWIQPDCDCGDISCDCG